MNTSELNILVVDDDKNIRFLLTQCLEESGYHVVPAVDGEHALEKMHENEFDLVMLDMKLPGMDGITVLRKIKSLAPEQAVVIITAHGTIETAVEAMKIGAADYLQKPFTPEEIRAIVQHNLVKGEQIPACPGGDAEQRIADARQLIKHGNSADAAGTLLAILSADPGRADVFNLIGVADERRGDLDSARRMYRVAATLDPSYLPAVRNLDRICQLAYTMAGVDLGE